MINLELQETILEESNTCADNLEPFQKTCAIFAVGSEVGAKVDHLFS